jgi:hypothetical protein
MVNDTQNYWGFELLHCPEFYVIEDPTFQKLDLFPSSGEKERHQLSWAP